jgi:uncharacterized protein (TIGR04222 family)
MTPDPFDWNGPAFLMLYAVLFVIAFVASTMIGANKRPEGSARGTDDPDALAFLAGGPTRFAEALVTRLLARGAMSLSSGKAFTINVRNGGITTAERAMLGLSSPTRWAQLAQVATDHGEPLTRDLERQGLLMSRVEAETLRWWKALPFLGVFGIGAIKLAIGVGRDKPVGFLAAFMIATALAIFVTLLSGDRRTQAGIRAVNDARAKKTRLRGAPTREEVDLAVALFGTGVLMASTYAGFHVLRRANGEGGGSDGSSSSDGGCGGGGCGGCGGD